MKIKIGESTFGVALVESREKELTLTVAEGTDFTAIRNAVEGAEEIDYADDEGGLVYRLIGSYRLRFIGGEGEDYCMRFSKTDTLEARIAALEAENESLRTELLDTQEALAELCEGGEVTGG